MAKSLVPDGDRLKKIPINIWSMALCCNSDDPTTWCSFEDAAAYVAANAGSGIGFALGKEVGVVVVDFDKTRAMASDEWPEWMLTEVEKLDSFTEVSSKRRVRRVCPLPRVIPVEHEQAGLTHRSAGFQQEMFCTSQAMCSTA